MDEIASNSPIDEKVAWARQCFDRDGSALLNDPGVSELLKRLRDAHLAASSAMKAAGIVGRCRACEEEDGGSCCGAGIENRYDGVMILINLLLGAGMPEIRLGPSSCYFLGPSGCLLSARHTICVNYLCDTIELKTARHDLEALRALEGIEQEACLLLHARIGKLLSERRNGVPAETEKLHRTLEKVATYCDSRKVGDVGALGFRRSTHLKALLKALHTLEAKGVVVPDRTVFFDMGCGDGRVNLLMSYRARLSIGAEIDEWTLDDYQPLRNGLEETLAEEDLILPPDNIHLFCGDTLEEDFRKKIVARTGVTMEGIDLFYTYITLYREYADLIHRLGRKGAVFMIYGLDQVLPNLPGFDRMPGEGLLCNKVVCYRKR